MFMVARKERNASAMPSTEFSFTAIGFHPGHGVAQWHAPRTGSQTRLHFIRGFEGVVEHPSRNPRPTKRQAAKQPHASSIGRLGRNG